MGFENTLSALIKRQEKSHEVLDKYRSSVNTLIEVCEKAGKSKENEDVINEALENLKAIEEEVGKLDSLVSKIK